MVSVLLLRGKTNLISVCLGITSSGKLWSHQNDVHSVLSLLCDEPALPRAGQGFVSAQGCSDCSGCCWLEVSSKRMLPGLAGTVAATRASGTPAFLSPGVERMFLQEITAV